jgi:hypothetical protein
MKNKKLILALAVGLSIFTLAGCGMPNGTHTKGEKEARDTYMENNTTDPAKEDTSDGKDLNTDEKNLNSDGNDSDAAEVVDGGELLAASDLQGSVIEFSDNGCTINPVTNSDDGSTAVIEAEGYEDEGAKVTIKYGDNCTFQKAVISIATGEATVTEVDKTDIKKKTSLVLYGTFEDKETFTATKAVITNYEREDET